MTAVAESIPLARASTVVAMADGPSTDCYALPTVRAGVARRSRGDATGRQALVPPDGEDWINGAAEK